MSARIYPLKSKEKPSRYNGQGHAGKKAPSMVAMAESAVPTHITGLHEAESPEMDPFPFSVMVALLTGALGGAMIGLLSGMLFYTRRMVFPGTEPLYLMGTFTFHIFWMLAGLSLGVMLGGLAAILLAPGPEPGHPGDPSSPED